MSSGAAADRTLVIRHGTLIDGSGRPPVTSRTRSPRFSLRTFTVKSAPSRLPIASRESRVPVRMTRAAPSALQSCTAISPIGPGPCTRIVSPAT